MAKNVLVMMAVLLLAAVAAAEPTSGVVEETSPGRVTVSGRVYTIEKDTDLTDLAGDRIDPSELKPGTPVEVDLDDEGHLVLLRATLVR